MRADAFNLIDRTLTFTSALLFGMAGVLWWRASSTTLVLDPVHPDPPNGPIPWWAGLVLAVALALAVGAVLVRRLRTTHAVLAAGAVTLGVTMAGVAVWSLVLPEPHPTTAVGPAVSATLLGFGVALLACVLIGLALTLRAALRRPWLPRPSRRSAVPAAAVALVLTCLTGLVVLRLDGDYQLWRNEYRWVGDVDRSPAESRRSELTGGKRWEIQIPGLHVGVAATRYGLAVVSDSSVDAIDLDTGVLRWRYTRADTDGDPQLMAFDEGRRVLVWWDPTAPYVLDARTGERLASWRWPTGQTVLLTDPLVVQRPTTRGSVVVGLTATGEDRWSYELSACDHPYAVSHGGTFLLSLLDTCDPADNRVQQLTSDTGRVRWTARGVGGPILTGTSRVTLFATGDQDRTQLTALRVHDGSTAWSRPVVFPDAQRPCDNLQATAKNSVAILTCGYTTTDPDFNDHVQGLLTEYDLDSGDVLRTKLYDRGVVDAIAIDAGGRRIITFDQLSRGCVIAHRTERGESQLALHPDDTCHCSYITVRVWGEQVILVDQLINTISTLR